MYAATDADMTIVVETVWSNIEPFLDLASTVLVSRTCHALHRVIVDVGSPFPANINSHTSRDLYMVKVTHIEVNPNWDSWALLAAMHCLHYPSLKCADLDFSKVGERMLNETAGAFEAIAENIGKAQHLERFRLHAGELIAAERGCTTLFDRFGENLAMCGRLEELEVINLYFGGDDLGEYSVALTGALIPTLQMRNDTLRTLRYEVGGCHSTAIRHQFSNESAVDSLQDTFFQAVFSIESLRTLDISTLKLWGSWPLLGVTNAVSKIGETNASKPLWLRFLRLRLPTALPQMTRIGWRIDCFAPLLNYFAACASLEHLELDLPEILWSDEDIIESVANLTQDKPKLTYKPHSQVDDYESDYSDESLYGDSDDEDDDRDSDDA